MKIHVRNSSDEILGATVVARHACGMINNFSLAMGEFDATTAANPHMNVNT